MTEFNLNGFIKFPTKSQKKFKSIKWKVKGEEYISEADADNDNDSSPDYLCFTAVDGDASVSMVGQNFVIGTVTTAPTIYYSFDKVTWTSWIENNAGAAINLTNGQSVYMYGENPNGVSNIAAGDTYSFQMTGKIEASGNIQTLLSKAGDRMDVPVGAFYALFLVCSSLTTAPELPATTLEGACYIEMFAGCTSLVIAPSLPATTLAQSCYHNMFNSCSKLQSVTTYVTEWNTSNTYDWLSKAGTNATNPTVYCPADSTIPEDNNDGIPTGWTRADLPTS